MPEENNKPQLMKKIITFVVGFGAVIGLITGIFTIDNRYVTVDKLQAFEKTVNIKIESQRLQTLTDRYYQMRQLVIQHPDDKQLEQDLKDVQKDKEESKITLDKLTTTEGKDK